MFVSPWLMWALAFGTLLSVLLAVVLWSNRTQRRARVRARRVADIERLPGVLEAVTRASRVGGNEVALVENGEVFTRLLEDIEAARDSVHLEVFVWWRGEICHRIANALAGRAADGVEVRVLVDAYGSVKMEQEVRHHLEEKGVDLQRFHPLGLRTIGRLNRRDHRKIAVVDGRIGWTFGHGIASEWDGQGASPDSWRDLGIRVRGPGVERLQAVFLENWMETTAEVLTDRRYFPGPEPAGEVEIQVVSSSPRGGVSHSALLYQAVFAAVEEELLIMNPYFAPGAEIVALLEEAARNGVVVRALLPGPHTDSPWVQWAGRHDFERLLDAGVEILEYQPTFAHQKVVIADRQWSYIGSANLDDRSLDINDEIGVCIQDPSFAKKLAELFEQDADKAKRWTSESWAERPWHWRARERTALLVRAQL